MRDSIGYAKSALRNAVNSLPLKNCKLSMTKFGSRVQAWSKSNAGLFNNYMRESAIEWINQLDADMGGTEMESCLEHVLNGELDQEYKRQVLLITDAGIYDCRNITKLVKNHYENSPRDDGTVPTNDDPQNRFFVLGVGSGVSKSLCEDIANAGGGVAAFCQADASVEEKTARLLAYAVRRPPLAVRNEKFEVELLNGNQAIEPINLDQGADAVQPTGFPNNIFNGTSMGPIGQNLTEEVTHFKYGCVLDDIPPNGIKVKVTARMEYSLNGRPRIDASLKEKQVQFSSGRNPLYYSYVKDELNRMQIWLDEFGRTDEAADRKTAMINLSTTTNLLCSLTAFVGERKRQGQTETQMEVDEAQRPRLETDRSMDVDSHCNAISRSHMPPAGASMRKTRKTRPSGGVQNRKPAGGIPDARYQPVGGSRPKFRKASLVEESGQDAVRLLLQNLKINGTLPRTEQTDSSLKKLSGEVFDMNDKEKRDQLIKQLSEKLSTEQIELLKGNAELLQTITFVIFLIRYAKASLKNHQKILKRSIEALAQKLGEPQLDQKIMTELASNLTF